jgi:hypothetical protein
MKYKKKPVVIEAFQMGIDDRPDWFQDKVSQGKITTHVINKSLESENPFELNVTYCLINTLEGKMKGDYGDYIIKGVKDEIYPCKPDIFEMTYDKVIEL